MNGWGEQRVSQAIYVRRRRRRLKMAAIVAINLICLAPTLARARAPPSLSILSSPYLPFITTLHPINRESFQHLRGLSNMTSAFLLIFGHLRAILGTLYTNIEHSITLFPLALVISPTYIFPYLRDR